MFFLLPLLSWLAGQAAAQSTGTFTISNPSGDCILIAQVANLQTPLRLTAMRPVCPSDGAESIGWPLTSAGDGASSALAIYGHMKGQAAGCVMSLDQMQAMYLLGRSLEWRGGEGQLFDQTAGGVLMNPVAFNPIVCGGNGDLLPSGMRFPDISNPASAAVWSTPITPSEGGVQEEVKTSVPPPPPPPTTSSDPPPPSPPTTSSTSIVAVETETTSTSSAAPSSSSSSSASPSTSRSTTTSRSTSTQQSSAVLVETETEVTKLSSTTTTHASTLTHASTSQSLSASISISASISQSRAAEASRSISAIIGQNIRESQSASASLAFSATVISQSISRSASASASRAAGASTATSRWTHNLPPVFNEPKTSTSQSHVPVSSSTSRSTSDTGQITSTSSSQWTPSTSTFSSTSTSTKAQELDIGGTKIGQFTQIGQFTGGGPTDVVNTVHKALFALGDPPAPTATPAPSIEANVLAAHDNVLPSDASNPAQTNSVDSSGSVGEIIAAFKKLFGSWAVTRQGLHARDFHAVEAQ